MTSISSTPPLEAIQSHMQVVVLRMDRVPFVDATGIQTLIEVVEDFQRDKSRVVLVGLRESVRAKLDRAGLIARLGADNVHASLADFARAESGRGRQPE